MRLILSAMIAGLLLALPAFAEDKHDHKHDHDHKQDHKEDEKHDHGAHVHGHVEMKAALDGHELAIELEAPGADIVGFEHHPSSDADRAAVAGALAKLEDAGAMFRLTAAARCALEEAHAEHHSEEGETHSEFHAHYHFHCDDPDALTSIELGYFDHFPGTEEIDAVFLGPRGQAAAELNAGSRVMWF